MKIQPGFATRLIPFAFVACSVLFAFAMAGASYAGGVCNSAMIAEDFVLPDGTAHPAGKLTLCLKQDYSPVSSLHEARVDGMPLGAMSSRHDKVESSDVDESLMLFIRESTGTLRLVGYTRLAREHSELYSFVDPSVTTSVGAFLPRALAGLRSPEDGDPAIVRVPAT